MSLKPTDGRMALVQAVADGAVEQHYGFLPSRDYITWDRGPGYDGPGRRYLTVDARVNELVRAGWVRLGEPVHEGYRANRRYEVTDAGQAALDEWGAR